MLSISSIFGIVILTRPQLCGDLDHAPRVHDPVLEKGQSGDQLGRESGRQVGPACVRNSDCKANMQKAHS